MFALRTEAGQCLVVRGERIVPSSSAVSLSVDLGPGELRAGLINSHDHLFLNHFPRLGSPPYRSLYAWADDVQHRFAAEVDRYSRAPTGRRAPLRGPQESSRGGHDGRASRPLERAPGQWVPPAGRARAGDPLSRPRVRPGGSAGRERGHEGASRVHAPGRGGRGRRGLRGARGGGARSDRRVPDGRSPRHRGRPRDRVAARGQRRLRLVSHLQPVPLRSDLAARALRVGNRRAPGYRFPPLGSRHSSGRAAHGTRGGPPRRGSPRGCRGRGGGASARGSPSRPSSLEASGMSSSSADRSSRRAPGTWASSSWAGSPAWETSSSPGSSSIRVCRSSHSRVGGVPKLVVAPLATVAREVVELSPSCGRILR